MPKNKKESDTESESNSDSDSGPEDRNEPPPAKKANKETDKDNEKKAPTKKSGEKITNWCLEKTRQVNINEFRGRQMVDIREFYEKDGKMLPGKKGISLSISQWKTLLEMADEINQNLD